MNAADLPAPLLAEGAIQPSDPPAVDEQINPGLDEAQIPDSLWALARANYRAGHSLRQVERETGIPFNLLHRRSKSESWTHDIKPDVQNRAFERLCTSAAEGSSRVEDLIEAGAKMVEQRQKVHQRVTGSLGEALQLVADEVKTQVAVAREAGPIPPKTLTIYTGQLQYLSVATQRFVQVDRINYGLNEGSQEKPYEDRIREWFGKKVARAQQTRADVGGG